MGRELAASRSLLTRAAAWFVCTPCLYAAIGRAAGSSAVVALVAAAWLYWSVMDLAAALCAAPAHVLSLHLARELACAVPLPDTSTRRSGRFRHCQVFTRPTTRRQAADAGWPTMALWLCAASLSTFVAPGGRAAGCSSDSGWRGEGRRALELAFDALALPFLQAPASSAPGVWPRPTAKLPPSLFLSCPPSCCRPCRLFAPRSASAYASTRGVGVDWRARRRPWRPSTADTAPTNARPGRPPRAAEARRAAWGW